MNTAHGRELLTGRVVTPDGVLEEGWVEIADGAIIEVGTAPTPAGSLGDGGQWIVPGFVDIHCHGGGGGSFTSPELSQARTAIDTHLAHGTTTMLASLVSAPISELRSRIATLNDLVAKGELAGIHLEGPFLSPTRRGAQNPSVLCAPSQEALDQLLSASPESIRMVTLAPELDHALVAIRSLAQRGIIAAIGHTDATLDQVAPAIDAGATVATHLFNGMRPLHHREPGAVGALLDDDRVTVELICDLQHLHPTVARMAAQRAGTRRTVLVTDAISATGAGDGTYELGALAVEVSGGVPRLADGSLAGSTLTMDAAFRHLVRECGLSIAEAVVASATRPAELLGLAHRVGAIRPGLAADLAVLDTDLRLRHVMKAGRWVS